MQNESSENEDCAPPLRIRNLEDLLRQLTMEQQQQASSQQSHHSSAMSGVSPTNSEDVRTSETEADRQFYSAAGMHTIQSRHSLPSAYRNQGTTLGHLIDGSQLTGDHQFHQLLNFNPEIPPPPPPPTITR